MNNNKLFFVLILLLVVIFATYFYKTKETFQSVEYNFDEIYIKGERGKQGAIGPKGDKGDQGPSGPACRNIIDYLETRGYLGLGETTQNKINSMNQLELKGTPEDTNSTFSKLKITDYEGTNPIMIGDNEAESEFYIKKQQNNPLEMNLVGDFTIDGNIEIAHQSSTVIFDQQQLFYNLMPKGIICCYERETNLPQGWAVCNGQIIEGFRTPDLRGKFIKGTTATEAAGTTNDNIFVDEFKTRTGDIILRPENIPAHSHQLSDSGSHIHTVTLAQSGQHNHNLAGLTRGNNYGTANNVILGGVAAGTSNANAANSSTAGEHTHTVTVSNDGEHTHTVSSVGASQTFNVMPNYLALVYIIKYK